MTEEQRTAEDLPLPGGDFRLFITRLSFQSMLSLGLLENPLTKERQLNLAGAQMMLEDLMMLRDYTRGNLAEQEAEHLDKVISDLEHAFKKVTAAIETANAEAAAKSAE